MYCNNHILCLGDYPKTFKSLTIQRLNMKTFEMGAVVILSNTLNASITSVRRIIFLYIICVNTFSGQFEYI